MVITIILHSAADCRSLLSAFDEQPLGSAVEMVTLDLCVWSDYTMHTSYMCDADDDIFLDHHPYECIKQVPKVSCPQIECALHALHKSPQIRGLLTHTHTHSLSPVLHHASLCVKHCFLSQQALLLVNITVLHAS